MFGMGKTVSIKLDKELHAKLTRVADVAGYATVDEFIAQVLEKEMLHFEDSKNDDEIRAKLKGLGYIS